MEYWQAWVIIIGLLVVAGGVGFGVAHYMSNNAVQSSEQLQEPSVTSPTPEIETKQETPKPAEKLGSVPTQPEVTTKQNNNDLKKIIDLYDSSVNGFLYYYKSNKYFVKNNKIKIEFKDVQGLPDNSFYNTVYLDTKTREAIALCKDLDDISGRKCLEFKGKAIPVQYKDFYVQTPDDWMNQLRSAKDVQVTFKSQTIFNRQVDEVIFGPAHVKVYTDHSYGVPIEIIDGKNKYDYLQLGINQVAAEDVMSPII